MLIESQLNYSCTKTSTKPRRDILHFGPLEGVAKGEGGGGGGGRKEGREEGKYQKSDFYQIQTNLP